MDTAKENSNEISINNDVEERSSETRLLIAPSSAKVLNISKGAAYRLIYLNQIPSVRTNRSVRKKQEDLDWFMSQHHGH